MKLIMPILVSLMLTAPALATEEDNSWDKAKESAGEAWKSAKEAGKNAWDATKEKSEKLMKDAEKEGGDLWDSAKEKSAELWEKGKEKGGELVDEAEKKAEEYMKPKEKAPESDLPAEPDTTPQPDNNQDVGNFNQSA
ncbi:hypothetical protein KU854_16065 [Enterovibrio sp. NIFS-20-8]|nr:hypothetical protein [Enterovibrio paralichthyis]